MKILGICLSTKCIRPNSVLIISGRLQGDRQTYGLCFKRGGGEHPPGKFEIRLLS